jgi:hypothetical protein
MEPALAIFAPFLAKCFAATLSPGVIDRHCFSAVYGEAHVRDTHVVTAGGKPVYSGETIYSFDGKGLEFTYFNSMGGVGHGTVAVQSPVLTFTGSIKADPSKSPERMAATWTIGEAGYDVAGEGQPVRRFTHSR